MNDLGIIDWKRRLIALGTDGASVNVGIHGGLGALISKGNTSLITSTLRRT